MAKEPERFELGPPEILESPHPPRRRWPKWLPLVLVGVVALIIILDHSRDTKSSSTPEPSPTPSLSSPSPRATPTPTPSSTLPVVVEELGHPFLGVRARWELFGRGQGVVVRIELAEGRITRSTIPGLASGGPVAFIVTRQSVLVRPLDYVAGYEVPDGEPAKDAPTAFSGGYAFPGPDLEHIWIQNPRADQPTKSMSLVDVAGNPTGKTIDVPQGTWVTSDGDGYLLVSDTGGVYEARPEGLRRVTTGAVLAVGPTRLLVWECDDQHRCVSVVIDRATGSRRVLQGWEGDPQGMRGVISPDGSVAALLLADRSFGLLDLNTGEARRLPVDPTWDGNDGVMVWSPDSRWLFVAGDTLTVIDARTGSAVNAGALGVSLPPLRQLAIRPAP